MVQYTSYFVIGPKQKLILYKYPKLLYGGYKIKL